MDSVLPPRARQGPCGGRAGTCAALRVGGGTWCASVARTARVAGAVRALLAQARTGRRGQRRYAIIR